MSNKHMMCYIYEFFFQYYMVTRYINEYFLNYNLEMKYRAPISLDRIDQCTVLIRYTTAILYILTILTLYTWALIGH
jgi:hypothetical protein